MKDNNAFGNIIVELWRHITKTANYPRRKICL